MGNQAEAKLFQKPKILFVFTLEKNVPFFLLVNIDATYGYDIEPAVPFLSHENIGMAHE